MIIVSQLISATPFGVRMDSTSHTYQQQLGWRSHFAKNCPEGPWLRFRSGSHGWAALALLLVA